METVVHDTAMLYRKMVNTPSLSEREKIYREELIAPFSPAITSIASTMPNQMDMIEMVKMWGFITPEDLTQLPSSLLKLEAHDAWSKSRDVLEKCVDCFADYQDKIGIETIHYGIFLGSNQQYNPLDKGYTGMGGIPGTIFAMYSQPNTYNLSKLSGLVAHEFHHNMQFSVFPWEHMNVSLAQWMIYEGMAESFSRELYGEDILGYYVTDFDMSQFEATKTIIQQHLDVKGFNAVRSYIYGDVLADVHGFEKAGVPAFAGYAIGYHVVQAYIQETGQSVVSATFVPAEDIIAQSKFFTS